MNKIGLPLIALLTAGFATVSIVRSQPRRSSTTPPAPPPVTAFSSTVAAVGLVEAASENIAIGTPLSGLVTSVHAQVGTAVSPGDPLFELDTRSLRAERDSRRAAVASAESRVRTAESVLEDLQDQRHRAEALAQTAVISPEELSRRRFGVHTAEARLAEAGAEVVAARALLAVVETELERSVIRSPIAAEVLQVNVRPGEFAVAGAPPRPLMVLGNLRPLHVRVDVDEHEGWRVKATAAAEARLRGQSTLHAPLKFVRFEPLVVPKRSLTGDATERVDTRVLQVIYEVVSSPGVPLFVGQQLDVFIEAGPGL